MADLRYKNMLKYDVVNNHNLLKTLHTTTFVDNYFNELT